MARLTIQIQKIYDNKINISLKEYKKIRKNQYVEFY